MLDHREKTCLTLHGFESARRGPSIARRGIYVRPSLDRRSKNIGSYSLAIALVFLATLITLKAERLVGEISPLFFAAVVISTWFGGLGPGLLATALAGWASAYFFYDRLFGWDDAIRLGVFLMVSLLMSSLIYLRKRAEDSLKRANDELETRVRERTEELESSMQMVVESEERFRVLMEGVADYAICMLDTSGRIISWNPGSERIHGYRQSEIDGVSFSILYAEADRRHAKPAEHLDRATADDRHEDEGWRIRKDGSAFWANVIVTSLRDPAGVLRGFAHITRDITELKRLEREVLEISENEQQRIGQDLHDGLGQELTGLAFLTQNLGRKLKIAALPEAAEEAQRISRLVNHAIEQTRELARGLSPVDLGADGLLVALRSLAEQVQKMCAIPIELNLKTGVCLDDHNAAVHLYRISQEAITNAARHSGASRIRLGLQTVDRDIIVTVEDDGVGIPADLTGKKGLGLRLMLYRARMVGAALSIQARRMSGQTVGTEVRCVYRKPSLDNVKGDGAIEPNEREPIGREASASI
jgi:PAS domain S-box-containing protein